MQLSIADYYLIVINVLGFILYIINMLLYKSTKEKHIDPVLTIVTIMAGSLGIVMAILLFDRKAVKDNMMSRVFVICMLVIQVIGFLFIRGHHTDTITFAFGEFLGRNKMFLFYLLAINIVTFAAFALDKIAALEGDRRIQIITLLGLAFIGGSLGGLIAMYLFRHKIRKDYFTVGIPLILIMQIIVLFYLMNIG